MANPRTGKARSLAMRDGGLAQRTINPPAETAQCAGNRHSMIFEAYLTNTPAGTAGKCGPLESLEVGVDFAGQKAMEVMLVGSLTAQGTCRRSLRES